MINIYEVHAAAKCSWIRRLYDDSNSKWKTTFLKLLYIGKNVLNKNLNYSIIKKGKSNFHRQTLTAWIKVYYKEPSNYIEMVNKFLVYNKDISVNRTWLTPVFFKNNSINHIYNIKINQIIMLTPQNRFVTLQNCNISNNTNITF